MEKKSKEVRMNASGDSNQSEKLTYEQLEQVANNLNNRCNLLYQQLQQSQKALGEVNEIGMLLDVLGKSEHFEQAFVERCASKIQELISKAMYASEKRQEETQE